MPHDRRVTACHEAAREVFAALGHTAGPELLSLDLTMGQFKATVTVTTDGPLPVGELGRRLGLSEPAASLLVDRLVELGIVLRERDPQDRRRTLVTATKAAGELATRLREGREDQVLQWLGALSDDELDGLTRGFRALRRVAQAEAPAGDTPPGSTRSGEAATPRAGLAEEAPHV